MKTHNSVEGNLISLAKEGQFELIVHGCNCFNTMGAGIALGIKKEFPDMYEADQQTVKGDMNKLGSYSMAVINTENASFYGVNAYTQFKFWGKERNADYAAIRSSFRSIANDYPELHIGYPQIGAGLAGGDWDVIYQIIKEELINHDHTLVIYDN